jgi:predicted transcriptional regulator of viral defense system
MKFDELLYLVGEQPVFETGLLLSGDVDPNHVRRQLSRWVTAGKIRQFRRGLYALEKPYQKVLPHLFVVANHLVFGSYVILQSALAYYGLIPEYVAQTTSVAPARPASWGGAYQFRHISPLLAFGYVSVEVSAGQRALLATPEKAILDLAHFMFAQDMRLYLSQLRLQNLDRLNLSLLHQYAQQSGKPKWERVACDVEELAKMESADYEEVK